jgi:GTP-binding protein
VGKSALVNRLCATQSGGAIVADVSGITRDRTYRQGTFMNRDFEVIDTGGLVFDDREGLFLKEIKEQALIAIEEATSLLLVVDGQKGLSPMDSAVADFLRTEVLRKKPSLGVFVAVNKCESERMGEAQAAEFWSLGLGKPKAISAIHGVGTAELLEAVFESVPERKPGELSEEEEETRAYLAEFGVGGVERAADTAPAEPEFQERETINVAIIGRPNVGKSSLLNNVFGASRAIVSDVAGTTRDSIDAVMEKRSGNLDMAPSVLYKFVDTAGIRRKSKVEFGPEFFMVSGARREGGGRERSERERKRVLPRRKRGERGGLREGGALLRRWKRADSRAVNPPPCGRRGFARHRSPSLPLLPPPRPPAPP